MPYKAFFIIFGIANVAFVILHISIGTWSVVVLDTIGVVASISGLIFVRSIEKTKQNQFVRCKFCNNQIPNDIAHLHQGSWVGECCWDERLRTTE